MNTPLGQWIEDNAELFKYAPNVFSLKSEINSILLSGGASICLAGLFRAISKDSSITAVDCSDVMMEDGKTECDDIECINENFSGYLKENSFDAAISVLQIQSLDTRELTPYLYNLYDCLKNGGVLYISFPDAIAPTVMGKNLYPSWYSMDEEVFMKYYMADDVIRALSLIGFDVKAMEADENKDLGHVVSLLCVKR